MYIQWTRVLYSVVLTRQSNPPISHFNSPCNEFKSVWSMFVYNTSYTSVVWFHTPYFGILTYKVQS